MTGLPTFSDAIDTILEDVAKKHGDTEAQLLRVEEHGAEIEQIVKIAGPMMVMAAAVAQTTDKHGVAPAARQSAARALLVYLWFRAASHIRARRRRDQTAAIARCGACGPQSRLGAAVKHQLVIAPPGTGFMAYAQRVYDATPPLSGALEVDVIAIRTAARMDVEVLRRGTALWPPFRCPHHTVSAAAMCGTLLHGWKLTPGEVSLAHGGILALDGIEDFSHAALTMVWRAVTDGDITISGPNETRVRVPARFQLIARVAPQSELGTRELIPEALHNQVTLLNEQDLAEALV